MKRFFARAGAKIGRLFWSRAALLFIFAVIVLAVLFYAEEDWRGAHDWAVTKAKWEVQGEAMDLKKIVPPSIPENANLGAIPLFQLDASGTNAGRPTILEAAMRQYMPGGDIPRISTPPSMGGLPDIAALKPAVAREYAEAFPKTPVPAAALQQVDALFPFLKDLLAASAARPLCRLPADYSISPPAARPLGGITDQIKLAKLLTLQAVLALDEHQPELALEDIETTYKLIAGVQRDPTLVAGLVGIGMAAINNAAIESGLMSHAWNDSQLAELQKTLASVDFLASYRVALRGEVCFSAGNIDVFRRNERGTLLQAEMRQFLSPRLPLGVRFIPPWPSGWWDENISLDANFLFNQLTIIDPSQRRVYPERAAQLQHQEELELNRWDAKAPWRIFFTVGSSPLQCASKFAFAQGHLDEARIACALERHHLTRGAYPSTLVDLVPQSISELPHDSVNGDLYQYRLRPNGTYLLYSIGWDLKDDGGTIAYRTDEPRAIDEKHGDWVWPTPK